MNTLEFFNEIYKYTEKNIYLWSEKKTYSFAPTHLYQMAAQATKLSKQGKNVYFGVCSSEKNLGEFERPKANEIGGISTLWIDIDIADAAHAATNLPRNIEEAISVLPADLPPSIVVFSGHGLHAYWLLNEDWSLDSDDERSEATALVTKLQSHIRQNAAGRNWHIDNTADLARILRVPDTFNYKDSKNPILCKVIEWSDRRYSIRDFEELPATAETQKPHRNIRNDRFKRLPTDGTADYIVENCAFIQYCEVHAEKITYSEWLTMLTNILRASDGVDAAHRLSALDKARYDERNVNEKIDEICANIANPQGCHYIQSTLGFSGCPAGGCGVNAPCGWALSHLARAKATVRKITIPNTENVLNEKTLAALAMLKQNAPDEYTKFRERCHGSINLNELTRALKTHQAEAAAPDAGMLREGQKVGDVTTTQFLSSTPIDLAIPAGYSYGANGIGYMKQQGDTMVYHIATSTPLVISRRVLNEDTGLEKIRLSFWRVNHWESILCRRSEVFSAKSIISLADRGINVSSESAKYLVKYLQNLEAVNQIPFERAVSKIGWRDGTTETFVIPNMSEYIIDMDDEGEITEAFSQHGSYDEWLTVARRVREMPFARFVLSAAFAAPLLKILQNRNFLIYFWGTSGGGKTASQMFSLSVWGDPERLMKSFYGTQNGLERALAFSNDFPLVINEKQVMNGRDKQEMFEQIVYMLEGGRGKLRASRNGLQKTATWRTIGMASGEEPLSRENSIQGVKTRLLELNIYPVIPDNNFAKSLYTHTKQHYGYAGSRFIEKLVTSDSREEYREVREMYHDLIEVLQRNFPEHFSVHIDNVALVCMGDYLSSRYIFEVPEKQARHEAYQLAGTVLGELPTHREISDVERGWDFVQNWIAANEGRIEKPGAEVKITPIYGFWRNETLCIFPEFLTEALRNAGFSPEKLFREFADSGKIKTQMDGGKRRFKVKVQRNGQRVGMIQLVIAP